MPLASKARLSLSEWPGDATYQEVAVHLILVIQKEYFMSNIVVVSSSDPALKGTTLFVEDQPAHVKKGHHRMDTGGIITPSAVYVPANHDMGKDLNVIVWFHGHHVADYQRHIFLQDTQKGKTMLRESVDEAGKDVVLVVPFIGHREDKHDPAFVLPGFDGKGFEAYLTKLCDVLKSNLGSTTIGRLVIACHSGSGEMMKTATGALGNLKANLKQCWGYDCMYVNDYTTWMSNLSQQSLYFYQGNGSYASVFRTHWEYAYGTPNNPKKPRLNHVFLAPGTKNPPADLECLTDAEIFQSFEAIKLKADNCQKLTTYEIWRLNDLDPLLDKAKDSGWATKVSGSVKGHYQVVQDLVAPRIEGLFAASPLAAGLLAQLQAQCKAGVRKTSAPPPLPKPRSHHASVLHRK
jgi:hypothetical protein